jgi:hypothetical protein
MTTIAIAIAVTITITITVSIKVFGKVDLNKLFNELHNSYMTKKYNKKANDYDRLFPYFYSSLIRSPSGQLVQYLLDNYNIIEYYPDYERKKIFVLKDDENRKTRENKIYLRELTNSPLGRGCAPALEEKDKFRKVDYYCHKGLSKDFKYYLELNKLIETNYTFQKIIQAKWQAESALNIEIMKQNKKI